MVPTILEGDVTVLGIQTEDIQDMVLAMVHDIAQDVQAMVEDLTMEGDITNASLSTVN